VVAYRGIFKVAIMTNNKAKCVASHSHKKVLSATNKGTVTVLSKISPEQQQIVCFAGCGEAGKLNDKASDAEHVQPIKGAQQHKQKDNDRIIINIARKEFKKRYW